MLTPKEVAQKLRVDRTTVYRWIRSGALPSLKFVGVRRIEEEVLDQFIRQRSKKSKG